jgi:hypothetical protein
MVAETNIASAEVNVGIHALVMGRYRPFNSVSVFGIFLGFFHSVRFSVSVFLYTTVTVRFLVFVKHRCYKQQGMHTYMGAGLLDLQTQSVIVVL